MDSLQVHFRFFNENDINELVAHIHHSIKDCYPKIYDLEVVDFFIDYHSKDNLRNKTHQGKFILGLYGRKIIACGYLLKNEIGGVYVRPEFQQQGTGRKIVLKLLAIAKEQKKSSVWLDATPLAYEFYLSLGFTLVEKLTDIVQGKTLDYYKMQFQIKQDT